MARADYRLCDVCDNKAFYDANLTYDDPRPGYTPPYRIAGKDQYDDPALNAKYGIVLGYVGDWAVICEDCAKTHRTVIVPLDPQAKPAT